MSAARTAPRLEPVPLASFAFARAYATTMRPYLLFVSGITGIVGMALIPGVPALAALGIGLAFFASYGFGRPSRTASSWTPTRSRRPTVPW